MARILRPINILIALLVILILIGIALAVGYAFLPTYLENRLLPKLAADTGLTEFDLEVRRVGLWGADLATIRLGPPSNPGLLLDNVQIDYTPSGLLNKKIERLVVNGIQLSFAYENGRLRFDRSLSSVLKPESPKNENASTADKARLPFELLVLRHARVRLVAGEKIYSFPLELDLLPVEGSRDQIKVKAVIWPRDQRMECAAEVDLEGGTADIRMKAPDLSLNAFADFADSIPGLRMGGAVGIESQVKLVLSPFKISAAEAVMSWFGDGIRYHTLRISPAARELDDKSEWRLKAVTTDGARWQVKADPILAESQASVQLSGLKATVQPVEEGYSIEGHVSALPLTVKSRQLLSAALKLNSHPRIDGNFNATINRQAGWSFTFEGIPSRERLKLEMPGRRLDASMAAFKASGQGDTNQITAEYRAALNGLRIRSASFSASARVLALKGKTILVPGSPGSQRTEFSISIANADGGTDGFKFSGARAGFFGTYQAAEDKGPEISGTTRFSVAKLTAASSSVRISKVSGKLPLIWPPPKKKGKSGSFKVASAGFQNYQLSELTGVIRQNRKGIDLEGRHPNALIPGLDLKYNGKAQFFGHGAPIIDFTASANRSQNAAPVDLGTLMPGGHGVQFTGRLEVKADLHVDVGGANGRSTLQLANGMVQATKENFKISGLQLGLEMPSLPVLRSAPGQILSFAKAQLGEIQIQDGRIFFQIESAPAVLIEKGQFDWSDGQVDIQSTRIFLEKEDYELTLFCDQLNLPSILRQFGAADAEGSGTVSGKIPISYRNGLWSVSRGFLYSPPGEVGRIRLKNTELLSAVIPKGIPQSIQLDIAREALKDYKYTWASLTVSTEGEDMQLKLKFDGEPANRLPFVFSQEHGGFARVDDPSRGSKFQGIRLDLNFALPLNKILQYKSLIQMIRKKRSQMMERIIWSIAAAFILITVVGCTEHKVKVEPVEVKPIHITVDVNVKVDRALDDYFGDIDAARDKIE